MPPCASSTLSTEDEAPDPLLAAKTSGNRSSLDAEDTDDDDSLKDWESWSQEEDDDEQLEKKRGAAMFGWSKTAGIALIALLGSLRSLSVDRTFGRTTKLQPTSKML